MFALCRVCTQKLRFRCSFMVPFQRYVMLRLCSERLAVEEAKKEAKKPAEVVDDALQLRQARRWDVRKAFIWACLQPSVITALEERVSRPGACSNSPSDSESVCCHVRWHSKR